MVQGLLIVGAFVTERRLQARGLSSKGSRALENRLSSCVTWAWLLPGPWDLPGPGIKLVSPALAQLLTTELHQGSTGDSIK